MAQPPLTTVSHLLPKAQASGTPHLLQSSLRYYHYGVDGFADHGWGCGYRTVQSMLSWLAPELPVPSIPTMQRVLAQAGSAVGPRGWIGVPDAVILLDEHATVIVRHLGTGGDWSFLPAELSAHFDGGGGPVMIGGGADVYSKTVVGVREACGSAAAALLVLDPHYAGRALEDPAALWAEGWVAWRPVDELLRADSFYNVGLPRRRSDAEGEAKRAAAASAPSVADEAGGAAEVDWSGMIEVVDSG